MAGRWKQIDYPGTADFSRSYLGRIFVDGSAAIRVQGLTLDDYAKKSFSRLWKVILTDSASETATGYFAEADGPEAYGGERAPDNCASSTVTEINATTGWSYAGDDDITSQGDPATGGGSYCIDIGRGTANSYGLFTYGATTGKLVKLDFWYKAEAGGGKCRILDRSDGIFLTDELTETSWTQSPSIYFVVGAASKELRFFSVADNKYARYDLVSVREVTALGADGCHIVSTKDGSTQNWETIDSGFDYNDTSMAIAIYQWKRHRWSGGRWWRPSKPYKNLWS